MRAFISGSEKYVGRNDAEYEQNRSPEHELGPDLYAVGLVLEEPYQPGAGGGHGGGTLFFLLAHLMLSFPEGGLGEKGLVQAAISLS